MFRVIMVLVVIIMAGCEQVAETDSDAAYYACLDRYDAANGIYNEVLRLRVWHDYERNCFVGAYGEEAVEVDLEALAKCFETSSGGKPTVEWCGCQYEAGDLGSYGCSEEFIKRSYDVQ
ncbi:MAG: hypothetical protein JRC86_07270 [Deltaproteobacteria bacterium]|nr:hypothetical protein [Deltaproteobacteria bacterium]